jgi:hypothetical protein
VKVEEEPKKATSRPPRQQQLHTTVLRGTKDFASLKEEWDELYESCPSATPFQSWAWLYSWWEVYGEGRYGLRLITLRDANGLLVGLLPLMVRRGLLLLLGGLASAPLITPYKDVLVREGWEGRVAEAATRALKGLGGWWVADLRELRPKAAAWELLGNWEGPKTSLPITHYALIHAKPWEELLASFSRKLRKSARNTLRRAEKDGLRCEPADLEDTEQAARRLVALHRELWQGRRIVPEHLTCRWGTFMEAAAQRMTAHGIGRISEFWRDDAVLISHFLLFDKDFVDIHAIGASQEASRRYQFETLSNWDAINLASGRGAAYVNLMDAASGDKLRWADEVVSSHRVILGRTLASWIPYAGYHTLRDGYYGLSSKSQLYVHSEDAPRWVKKATHGYYALQSYVYSESAPRWVKKATEGYWALRREYGYHALLYKYELVLARRERLRSSTKASRSE